MEPNQVDGIKKLSKEEIKRSRDIVLDTIGETAPKPAAKGNDYLINSGNITKRMDGLSEHKKTPESTIVDRVEKEKMLSIIDEAKKNIQAPEKQVLAPQIKPAQIKKTAPVVKQPGLFSRVLSYAKKIAAEKKLAREASRARAEQDKKLKLERKEKKREEERVAAEKQKKLERAQAEKQLMESKRKAQIQKAAKDKTPSLDPTKAKTIEQTPIKEIISIAGYDMLKKEGVDFVADLKSEKLQKEAKPVNKPSQDEINLLRAEKQKRKSEELEKKRAEKQKLRELRKEKIKEFASSLNRRVALISKRSIYVTTITFVSCISVYFLILISIVQFDIDNQATRRIAAHIPIPAYISTDGIVEYFKYKDIKTELLTKEGAHNNLESEIKIAVVKSLVLENLARKYSLLFDAEKDFIPQISTQLAFDMDVNIVPINRIKKIKQLIEKQGDFVKVATKYGDELGQITSDYGNSQNLYYFDEIKKLELGQVSDTVLTPEGYYIFKCFDKDSASIALSYVFIKSNTLDDYINEEVKGYKLISFVD